MSNCICTVRSNYFHVKDPASFRDFMSRVYGSEDRISLWQEQDEEGRPVFGFGSYGAIAGVKNAEPVHAAPGNRQSGAGPRPRGR